MSTVDGGRDCLSVSLESPLTLRRPQGLCWQSTIRVWAASLSESFCLMYAYPSHARYLMLIRVVLSVSAPGRCWQSSSSRSAWPPPLSRCPPAVRDREGGRGEDSRGRMGGREALCLRGPKP